MTLPPGLERGLTSGAKRRKAMFRHKSRTASPLLLGLSPVVWIPFNDLGAGVVDTASVGGVVTPSFTRATTAWTRLSTGLWVSIASGSPRSYYDANLVYKGFLCERNTTNRCLHSRDLTQAVWVSGGGGITPLKNAVGIDGAANSCSTITAAGADGTLLQGITNASVVRTFSCYMKRSVGTGTISITLDGGATWTDITSQLSTTAFALVQIHQTLANPSVGFKITTSGDAVIVDMCQEETTGAGTKGIATTPYPAGAAAVTRNSDQLSYATGAWFNAAEGAMSCEYTPEAGAAVSSSDIVTLIVDANNTINWVHSAGGPSRLIIIAASVTQADISTANSFVAQARAKTAFYYKANDCGVSLNAGAIVTDVSVTLPAITSSMSIGSGRSGVTQGSYRNVMYFNRRPADPQVVELAR